MERVNEIHVSKSENAIEKTFCIILFRITVPLRVRVRQSATEPVRSIAALSAVASADGIEREDA